jgi:hypothetical protein
MAAHADMPHEVTVIKSRRFPTCRHCKGIRFERQFSHMTASAMMLRSASASA